MRVRPAEEADVPSLHRLFIEGHEFHARGVPDRLRVPERYDREELSSAVRSSITGDRSSILLLEDAGEIVGLVEISIHDDESNRRLSAGGTAISRASSSLRAGGGMVGAAC